MERSEEIVRKRVGILHRYFSYVCDRTNPFTTDDLKALRQRFAVNAGVQKQPDDHKWLLKLTSVFENMGSVNGPDERAALYKAVNRTFADNALAFKMVNPDESFLKLIPQTGKAGNPGRTLH